MKCLVLFLWFVTVVSARRAAYVVGGAAANITDWPFMVSVQLPSGHVCGGSLVDSTHVVTSANCAHGEPPSAYTLVLGTNDIVDNEAGGRPQRVGLSAITIHPDFNDDLTSLVGNVAVLTLASEVSIDNTHVRAIGLATPEHGHFAGAHCRTAGWGGTADDISPNILHEASVIALSNEECKLKQHTPTVEDAHICFQDGVHSPCFGDSGGPLICRTPEGKEVLVGVTISFSVRCNPRSPALYTRVSHYHAFLQEQLQ